MTSHDLTDRADLEALLQAFSGMALCDRISGPVFASASMGLEAHLPRIASFWEVTLLGIADYFGRPMHRHPTNTAGLGVRHLQRWLALRDRTLTAMFTGPTTDRTKTEAARIADRMVRDLFHRTPRPLTALLHAAPRAAS